MPHVTLTPIGNGAAEGTLRDHPAPNLIVRTQRVTPTALRISLHERGERQIGEGVLRLNGVRWEGECSELGSRWIVNGRHRVATFRFWEG